MMKRIIGLIVVGVLSNSTILTNAYVTNNNHNNNGNSVVTTTIKNKNIMMDWLPKNAFLPKANLIQIQEQLIHTVLNIQLDMETTATTTKAVSRTTTLDPNQEFIGWNTNTGHRRNMDRNVVKKSKKDTMMIKSSHLLLQQRSSPSSSDQTLPRLPIRNLQFILGTSTDSVLKAHERSSSSSSETSITSDHSSSGGDVGYSTTTSSTTSRTTMNAKENHHHPIILLPMPGYNGPHPLLSSGILPLNIQNCGEYVTLQKGIQSLPLSTTSSERRDTHTQQTTSSLLQPQWEVIWKEQSPTGTIVCGMQLQHSICRNDIAMIPAGMMYISFPIWDGTQLIEYQKKKIQYDITTKLYSQERDNEIDKMTKSNNIFNKLMHYKNAITAAESYSLQPHKTFKNVPTTLSDLIAIDNNSNNSESNQVPLLYIVPKGMVRIVPTETMQQWTTPTTPCGKQQSIIMNPNLLWSSTSSTSKNNINNNNNILHGTAKISNCIPPSVQQSSPPLRTLTTKDGTITTQKGTTTTTTTSTTSSSNTQVPLMDDVVVSSTNTDTDTSSFM